MRLYSGSWSLLVTLDTLFVVCMVHVARTWFWSNQIKTRQHNAASETVFAYQGTQQHKSCHLGIFGFWCSMKLTTAIQTNTTVLNPYAVISQSVPHAMILTDVKRRLRATHCSRPHHHQNQAEPSINKSDNSVSYSVQDKTLDAQFETWLKPIETETLKHSSNTACNHQC